jgi:hypothetical protein
VLEASEKQLEGIMPPQARQQSRDDEDMVRQAMTEYRDEDLRKRG